MDEMKIRKEDLGSKKVAVYFDYSKSPEDKTEEPSIKHEGILPIRIDEPTMAFKAKLKERSSRPKVSQRISEDPPLQVG